MNDWDTLESELRTVRGLLDDADGTPLGKLEHLLDRMATHTDNALRQLEDLRAREGRR